MPLQLSKPHTLGKAASGQNATVHESQSELQPHQLLTQVSAAMTLLREWPGKRRANLFIVWPDTSSFQLRPAYFGALLDVSCGVCQHLIMTPHHCQCAMHCLCERAARHASSRMPRATLAEMHAYTQGAESMRSLWHSGTIYAGQCKVQNNQMFMSGCPTCGCNQTGMVSSRTIYFATQAITRWHQSEQQADKQTSTV